MAPGDRRALPLGVVDRVRKMAHDCQAVGACISQAAWNPVPVSHAVCLPLAYSSFAEASAAPSLSGAATPCSWTFGLPETQRCPTRSVILDESVKKLRPLLPFTTPWLRRPMAMRWHSRSILVATCPLALFPRARRSLRDARCSVCRPAVLPVQAYRRAPSRYAAPCPSDPW